jgi:alkylation response protein AidB-like acyl-CoA dehydrogenase
MMEFDFTEEQKMLQTTLREFATAELEPVAAQIDKSGEFPAAEIKKMADLGLFGLIIPEKYGGSGRGKTDLCIAVEELARASAAIDNYFRISLSLSIVPIMQYGTEAQKQAYLPAHARGEKLACFAWTESASGSDPSALKTSAVKKGGGYVINGTKQFISLGDKAGVTILFAVTDPSLRNRGITAFIVDKGTPGLTVNLLEDKLGMHGLSSTELVFQDCFIPEENRIGEEGQGIKIALDALDISRITVGAEAVGISRAAYEAALKYSREREQFGEPIANFQAIQWMLVDMATQIDAARLMTYQAAFLCDQGRRCLKEAAMAKLYASEVAAFVTSKAIQIHGGYGYMRSYPVERYFRDAKITEIYEGTSEIMRLTIAREILRQA